MKLYDVVVYHAQNHSFRTKYRKNPLLLAAVALIVPAIFTLSAFTTLSAGTSAGPLSLCGNPGPAPVAIQHVIVVMMENLSYNQVVGSANAPYQTSLANQCGVAPDDFGVTHTSAANYLAVSAGEFPPTSLFPDAEVSRLALTRRITYITNSVLPG